MKFTCHQQQLAKGLNTVSKAISNRTTIPALKGILLKADENNQLTLTSSDMDFSIERTIDADVQEPGSVIVMAKLFSEIIRKLPYQVISVSVDEDEKVTITTDTSEFTIVGMAADEFPNIGTMEETSSTLLFDRNLLRSMINKTQFCVSNDESRGIITGLLMELEENSFNMAALDGFRMAVARETMKNAQENSLVIHGKIMNEINKILGESDEEEQDITFLLGNKKATIIMDRTRIIMRLLDGEFIKYKDILKTEKNTQIIIDKKALSNAIERASLLAKEGKNNLVILKIEEDVLTIRSTSEEGRVKEQLTMDKRGNDLEIGFNSKYLLDALKVIDDEQVVLDMNTAVTPCILHPIEGNAYEYLILPVRIPAN